MSDFKPYTAAFIEGVYVTGRPLVADPRPSPAFMVDVEAIEQGRFRYYTTNGATPLELEILRAPRKLSVPSGDHFYLEIAQPETSTSSASIGMVHLEPADTYDPTEWFGRPYVIVPPKKEN